MQYISEGLGLIMWFFVFCFVSFCFVLLNTVFLETGRDLTESKTVGAEPCDLPGNRQAS